MSGSSLSSPTNSGGTGSGGDSAYSPIIGDLLGIPSAMDKSVLEHATNHARTRSPMAVTHSPCVEPHPQASPGTAPHAQVPHLLDIPWDESVVMHVSNESHTRSVYSTPSSGVDLHFHGSADATPTDVGDDDDDDLLDPFSDSDSPEPSPISSQASSPGLNQMSSDSQRKEAEVEVSIVPTLGPTPSPCEGATLCWARSGAFLFGGYLGSDQGYSDALWRLDFDNTEWQQLRWRSAFAPEARSSHVAAMIDPTHMLVFGGTGNSSLDLNDTWVYDELSAVWTELEIAEKPLARRGAGAACVRVRETDFVLTLLLACTMRQSHYKQVKLYFGLIFIVQVSPNIVVGSLL